jgi:glycyl-tRNA synthetase
VDIPFGIAQIGKAFRNEISPRDFIFRDRELEMMEIEYFINPNKDDWNALFDYWLDQQKQFFEHIGIDTSKIRQYEHSDEDRSHYSQKTVDWEFEFPFGQKELTGLAYRTDFDLQAHIKHSGKNLMYRPKDGSEPFVPHVLEPTFGVERHILAVLTSAYTEDEVNGEKRVFLKLPAHIAPIKVAVSPLLKNKPELVGKGNIGKRYRRQDEIGTPNCVTIDFQTLEDNSVTVRNRDTTVQNRIPIEKLSFK